MRYELLLNVYKIFPMRVLIYYNSHWSYWRA